MGTHYYSEKPSSQHNRQSVVETLRGQQMQFMTDSGVFSKSGIDFGSRLLIEEMKLTDGEAILDVGCGYGPIGLTACKLCPASAVTMIDINERAVELARENARLNGIGNADIRQSDLFSAVDETEYGTVLTNPPIRAGKDVVHAIFEGAWERLRSGGSLWVVIQKKQGAPSAFAKLETLFEQVEETAKSKGYRIFRAIKA